MVRVKTKLPTDYSLNSVAVPINKEQVELFLNVLGVSTTKASLDIGLSPAGLGSYLNYKSLVRVSKLRKIADYFNIHGDDVNKLFIHHLDLDDKHDKEIYDKLVQARNRAHHVKKTSQELPQIDQDTDQADLESMKTMIISLNNTVNTQNDQINELNENIQVLTEKLENYESHRDEISGKQQAYLVSLIKRMSKRGETIHAL